MLLRSAERWFPVIRASPAPAYCGERFTQRIMSGSIIVKSAGAYISDSVTIHDSLVCGQCRIFGHALINQHSMIVAAQGLTPDHQLLLQIYDRARVSASRIVHQHKFMAMPSSGMLLLNIAPKFLILPVLKVMKRTTSGYAIALKSTVTRRWKLA